MNGKRTTRVVIGRTGELRQKLARGRSLGIKGRTDWKRLADMSEAEIVSAARRDPDAPPTCRRNVGSFRRVTLTAEEVRAIRRKCGLSQSAFAARYAINLRTLQDWEQGRVRPDGPARAYLLVISREPRAVERALANKAG